MSKLIWAALLVSDLYTNLYYKHDFVIDANRWCLLGYSGEILKTKENHKTNYIVEYKNFKGTDEIFTGDFAILYELDKRAPKVKCR